MFLQISFPPKYGKTDESSGEHLKLKKDIYMVLRPFELPTRISIQTSVNTTTEHFVHISNTNEHTLNVNITKRPPEERFVELSFTSTAIEANGAVTLKITWSPKTPGYNRDVIQLIDSCRRTYEIILLMDAKDSRRNVRNPLISKSKTKESSYPSRNFFVSHNESSPAEKFMQSKNKRTRNDSGLVNTNKENVTNNLEPDRFTETAIKKPRKEILSKTFILSPNNCSPETREISETPIPDFYFSSQNKSFPLIEEHCETKTLRRETYVTTPKYRQKLIIIDENENLNVNNLFDDFLLPSEPRRLSDCPFAIDNINITPRISTSPDQAFQFSRRGSSTWTKRKKPVNVLSPIVPFPHCKRDFASSSFRSRRDDIWVSPNKISLLKGGNTEQASKSEEKEDSSNFVLHEAESLLLDISPSKSPEFQKKLSFKQEKIRKMSLAKSRKVKYQEPLVLKNKQLNNEKKTSLKLNEPNDFIINFYDPNPFAATIIENPFLSGLLPNNEKWVFLQEVEFKKWLNALMTAPEHLNTDMDSTSVDIGKVWQSCRLKEEVVLAESKESISARYHTNTRLNTLRKAASVIFRKDEVREAFLGVTHCLENGSLVIKKDKDPHRDIGLQKEILELFLSYNPLWLRIGLETVYEETIPLQSNNDLIGLTRFLLARFFSDPFILKKHSHPMVIGMKLPTFTLHMNNFMLKKFFQVVYFLDYAKMNKLIGHDPCLFRKKAPHKESRSILLAFSREVLSGIGDITKVLRLAGYVVNYKQTYLDEFDYAVHNISMDLRDGVRLCRTMELIRGKRNLTPLCRVPAISKLQKIHNVNIALTALLDSGYFLVGEINAKCIVNGDREKTLSLLWQIIYKFQAPRFEKAAVCLQTWWRSKLWYVRVKNFLKKHRNDAASVIQKAWRCYSTKKELNQLRVENENNLKLRIKAARTIEKWWIFRRVGVREEHKYLETKSSVMKIQRWWRRKRETKPFVENLRRKIRSVIRLQRLWRGKKLLQEKKLEYLKWNASRVIQKWWKRILILKRDRTNFLLMKHAVWVLEKSWIGKKTITEEREKYLKKRRNAIVIQRFWRRYRETKKEVSHLRICRKSSLKIQSWWRLVVVQREYETKKNSSVKIQNWWRSIQETKACQISYSRTKVIIVAVQRRWRAKKLTQKAQWKFIEMKSAAVRIQSWVRMMKQKRKFESMLKSHKAAVVIQTRWQAYLDKRKAQALYIKKRECVIVLQRKRRALQLARLKKNEFLEAKEAIFMIQKHWRCYTARKDYRMKREAVVVIQSRWREVLRKKQIEAERAKVLRKFENAVVRIQAAWKGYKVRKMESARMAKLRERSEKAARLATQKDTLKKRLQKSINVFLFSNDLGRLSMCLASLDVITRFSANGCITVCKVGLVDKIFMTLVQSNRSLPWMDVCMRATSILITLAKYSPTKPFVLKKEYIETLARLLTVTVDKEIPLFLQLATLMWILVEDAEYAKSVLENSRSAWLLKSLYGTVNRKQHKFVPANPETMGELLPNPKHDWGLKQKQPRLFENVFHAVSSISKRLSEYQ